MKRLEVAGVRVCKRCGRGRVELTTSDGATFSVPVDADRAEELARGAPAADVHSLVDFVLAQIAASGAEAKEVVFDTRDGRLHALFSLTRSGEPEVLSCTPQEGVALAMRGGLKLYATDEVLAGAATASGAGGPDTLH